MTASVLKVDNASVRGVVGETLTPAVAAAFAAALGTYTGGGRILLGTDTRTSRTQLSLACSAGLLSVGAEPVDLGVCPSPTLQHAIAHERGRGGIGITASNAAEAFNALRFYGPDGRMLRTNQFHELVDIYHQGLFSRAGAHEISEIGAHAGAAEAHAASILRFVDAPSIRKARLKVAVDTEHGATSTFMPRFLEELGCEVAAVNTAIEQPKAERQGLAEAVQSSGALLGLSLDADGDRLRLMDERGTPLDEDCTVAFAALAILARGATAVVVSHPTSRLVDDVAGVYGARVHRSAVGETNVVDALLETGARVGGEGNGGVIVPEVHPCRDGFVAAALVLELLAREGVAPSALRARFPSYHLAKYDLPCRPRRLETALRRLRRLFGSNAVDLADGIHVSFEDAWLHVRGANTEPVVRIVAESPTESRARNLVRQVVENLRTAVI